MMRNPLWSIALTFVSFEVLMVGAALLVFLLVLTGMVHAEPLPLPKPPNASCPFGYIVSSSYCVPSLRDAHDAVPKPPGASCPFGWIVNGYTACTQEGYANE
jgi:hypothetical protein